MNDREKWLGVGVLVVAAVFYNSSAKNRQRAQIRALEYQVRTAREQLESSRALLANAPKPQVEKRPERWNEATMKMLGDLTIPQEIQDLSVSTLDQGAVGEYKLVVEGGFAGLMRYLAYLERPEGHFRVGKLDLTRLGQPGEALDDGPGTRRIRAALALSQRGRG